MAERTRRWREQNAARQRELEQRWREANPDRVRELARNGTARRRARVAGAAVNDWGHARQPRELAQLEGDVWRAALLAEYGDRCAYCGDRGPALELEHDVPIALGGDHTWRNIVPACRTCNASKSDTTGAAFVVRRLLEGQS